MVTSDHEVVASDKKPQNQSRNGDRFAVLIQDWFTTWLNAIPKPTKSGEDTADAFRQFFCPGVTPEVVYSDNSEELKYAKKALGMLFPATSTPHIPQTNSIAENCVRKVKEGTACSLTQSGLTHQFWCDAMDCFCF